MYIFMYVYTIPFSNEIISTYDLDKSRHYAKARGTSCSFLHRCIRCKDMVYVYIICGQQQPHHVAYAASSCIEIGIQTVDCLLLYSP